MKFVKALVPALLLPWILTSATLHLKKRELTPGSHLVTLESPGPRWTSGRSHLVLQFRHAPSEQVLQELNERGAFVVGAVPDFGVVVSVQDSFSPLGLDLEWAGRLDMDDKISPVLERSRHVEEAWLVAEFHPDVDMREARRLAEAAGFRVREHPDLTPTHLLLSGPSSRLTGLAQWDEVAYVFPASRELMRGRHVVACAGALTSGGVSPMYVTTGSGWPKDASGQVTLSYVLGKITSKLDSSQANQEILRALNTWTAYAPIKFVAGTSASGTRTVNIQFAGKDHGDGFPFDGPGGILAHTFYPAPPNPEPIAGDMHLDADEDWHIGATTDLFTVVLHEAGHALGLAHVDNPSSIMYPYYRLGAKISADDIAGIQSLYGAPLGGPVPGPVTTISPLTLTISTPAATSTTTGSAIVMAGSTAGSSGAVRVTWQTNHSASGAATQSAGDASKWTIASIPLSVGANIITVTAADTVSRVVQTVSVTRVASATTPVLPSDRTPPSITISSPANSVFNTTAATIDIKGTASDSVGVARVTWQSSTGAGTASGTSTWIAGSIPLLIGSNTIVVRAYDAAGNMAWRSLLVVRY